MRSYTSYSDATAAAYREHLQAAQLPPNSAYEDAAAPEPWMLTPEDRIGPRPRRRLGAVLIGTILMLLAMAGGLAMLDDRNWVRVKDLVERGSQLASMLGPTAKPANPTAPSPSMAELPTRVVREDPALAPVSAAPVADAPEVTISNKPEEEEAAGPPERLPPPPVDKSDPLQVKAVSVGLHPELSRVLLGKLTATDYKNAGIAIKTALAEVPVEQDYTFPRQGATDLAVFHVRFVLGAPADCRRYIVTITKERWAHTALPMESCGLTKAATPALPRKG